MTNKEYIAAIKDMGLSIRKIGGDKIGCEYRVTYTLEYIMAEGGYTLEEAIERAEDLASCDNDISYVYENAKIMADGIKAYKCGEINNPFWRDDY